MLQAGSRKVLLKSVRLKHVLKLFVRDSWVCSTCGMYSGVSYSWQPHLWKPYIDTGQGLRAGGSVVVLARQGVPQQGPPWAHRTVELLIVSARKCAELCLLVFPAHIECPQRGPARCIATCILDAEGSALPN